MYLRIFGNDNYVFEIPWYLPFGDMVYLAIVGDFISFWQIMKYHDFDRYHDFMSCHEITISRYHDIDDIVMSHDFGCHQDFKMLTRWCHDFADDVNFGHFGNFRIFSLFCDLAHFLDFYLSKSPHFAFVRVFRKWCKFGPYFQACVPGAILGILAW